MILDEVLLTEIKGHRGSRYQQLVLLWGGRPLGMIFREGCSGDELVDSLKELITEIEDN